jgi:predicted dehydrogenase
MSSDQNPFKPLQYREKIGRRHFLTGTGAAAVSLSIANSELVKGSQANSKIRLGVVGCGMRGKWIADLFVKHGGYQIVAAADYFQDKVDEFGSQYGVPERYRYTTLAGYKRLLDQKPDAVVIESPPYFHPEQSEAAVGAGVHVFLAKPIAVDVPGVSLVQRLGPEATSKKLCFLVDFQTRTNGYFKEAVSRVQQGAIGDIRLGEARFLGGDVWNSWNPIGRYIQESPTDPEARLRSWGLDRALSGDILVEQCIHSIDIVSWILGSNPLTAYGMGGRYHYEFGDVWDCYAVEYRFPGGLPIQVSARQFGKGYSDMGCRLYGLSGTIDTQYGGDVSIRGDKPYEGGNTGNLYPEGASANIAEFYTNITEGHFENTTVKPSVQSHLAAILGRMASYEGHEVGWDEMIKANKTLESDLIGKLKG